MYMISKSNQFVIDVVDLLNPTFLKIEHDFKDIPMYETIIVDYNTCDDVLNELIENNLQNKYDLFVFETEPTEPTYDFLKNNVKFYGSIPLNKIDLKSIFAR